MTGSSAKKEVARLEAAMDKKPPVIHWRFDPVRKVQVAAFVYDPYAETGGRNADKQACKRKHPFTPENTIITSSGRQCRTCKNEQTAAWQASNPRVLTVEQRARKNEQERARRRLRRQREAMEDEAREVAERFEKHRAYNTPLQIAARTSI